jgi:hypothetical protein
MTQFLVIVILLAIWLLIGLTIIVGYFNVGAAALPDGNIDV